MDKIDRLLDAIEHPDSYTPTEIEAMLQDPEVKEVFDLLDKTRSSLQSIDNPDISEEWAKFENVHPLSKRYQRRWVTRFLSRNAAASIAVCIASFTAVAAIVGVGIYHVNGNSETFQEIEPKAVNDIDTSELELINPDEPNEGKYSETVVFENETLESIITRIGCYYECTVTFNNDAAKTLRLYFRWNQDLPVEEIVESLNNFEQINLTITDKIIRID